MQRSHSPVRENGAEFAERLAPPEHAVFLAQQEIDRLGLRAELTMHQGKAGAPLPFPVHDPAFAPGQEPRTWQCRLLDDRDREQTRGCGKGFGPQALAAALFESLEHWRLERSARIGVAPGEGESWALLPARQVADQLELIDAPWLPLLHKQPEALLACQTFHDAEGRPLFLPAGLHFPNAPQPGLPGETFNYGPLAKYASNSGTAAGASCLEASVHGILELVERDALSLWLLRTYVSPRRHPIRLIRSTSLPPDLARVVRTLEAAWGPPFLVQLETEFPVHAYMAVLPRCNAPVSPSGHGASLNPEYAAARALLEALQEVHMQDRQTMSQDAAIQDMLAPLPRYQRCHQRDMSVALEYNGSEYIDFKDAAQDWSPVDSLEEYAQELHRRLTRCGRRVFLADLSAPFDHVSCVQVMIPGLERFTSLSSGQVVLPGARGMAAAR